MATLCQFVTEIAASPTVVLDLNDTTRASGLMLGPPGLDLTPPELRRAVSSNLLRDGEAIPASAYGNRVVKIPLVLTTTSEDAAATAVRNLARQLDKATNTLRVKIGTTQVFFRTVRSSFALAMSRNLLR